MHQRNLKIIRRSGVPVAPAGTAAAPAAALSVPAAAVSTATAAAGAAAQLWAGVHLAGFAPEALQSVGFAVQRFTPRVSLAPPDGLLLEVRGSLHLFEGVSGLRRALMQTCRQFHPQPLLALAPTPLAALVMARAGRPLDVVDPAQLVSQLAAVPLAVLRWPQDIQARLARMGVRTLSAVLRLPRAGFARRFGVAQLVMLDRLTGRAADPRPAIKARARFRRRHELDHELTDHEQLLVALTPLWTDLQAFLEAHQQGVLQLTCRLLHRQAPATRCVMRFAAPDGDVQRLAALLRERLQQQCLAEPVRACELRTVSVPHVSVSLGLWQPGEQGGGAAAPCADLVEHLRARFGATAVHGLALQDDHRPETAWRVSEPPLLDAGKPQPPPCGAGPSAMAGMRPLWLLREPQPLPVRGGLPRRRGGGLRLASEPERIESGWWDGGEIARDYYIAVDVHGVRLWVFRERAAPHGWFLHGVFG